MATWTTENTHPGQYRTYGGSGWHYEWQNRGGQRGWFLYHYPSMALHAGASNCTIADVVEWLNSHSAIALH